MANKIAIAIAVAAIAYYARKYYSIVPFVRSPVVKISAGELQGLTTKSRDGRSYYEYLGIPYAKPPVGDLRFEPPEPWTKKWDTVRDATSNGKVCAQVNFFIGGIEGDEDCLFLNVHSPKLNNANLPVMVWFHGGLFSFGSGSGYRPDYIMDEDVVLVTVNYRLGSFGFLNTGDGVIRGNMGLKDQNMALRWVKENIANFGGNPNDVTIFGESAGGASVHFQMLSPMSKGLFHKAISQSGLAVMPWAVYPSPSKQATRFAKQLKCSASGTKEVVKCLKSRKTMEIANVHMEMIDSLEPMIKVFLPTIEKDISDGKTFLTQKPKALIEAGKFNKVPFLTGVNSEEGLFLSAPVVTNTTIFTRLNTNWEGTAPPLMLVVDDLEPQVLDKIRKYYIDPNGSLDIENPDKHRETLTNLFSDWIFNLGFHNGATSHAKQVSSSNPLFIYYYSYQGEFSLGDLLMAMKGKFPPIVEIILMKVTNWVKMMVGLEVLRYGACHADELAMQFDIPDMSASVPKDSKDYVFSKKIVKLWTSFAKSDAKSIKSLEFMGQKWPPQEPNKPLKYMQLDVSPKVIDDPFKNRLSFWHQLNLL